MKDESITYPIISKQQKVKPLFNVFLLMALAGIGGGLLSILIGFIFIIIHSLLMSDSLFDELGTILMTISIPMLLVGGYFMDKANEKLKK